MTRLIQMAFLATFAAAMTACGPGPSNCEGVECDTSDCNEPIPGEVVDNPCITDTGGPTGMARVRITVEIDGEPEACNYYVGDYARFFTDEDVNDNVVDDEVSLVDPGTYDIVMGNEEYGETRDSPPLYLHKGAIDGMPWCAPRMEDVEFPANQETHRTITGTRYIENQWTCWRDDTGNLATGTVEMSNCETARLPGLDPMTFVGKTMSGENGNATFEGSFHDDDEIRVVVTLNGNPINFQCWPGVESDRPAYP